MFCNFGQQTKLICDSWSSLLQKSSQTCALQKSEQRHMGVYSGTDKLQVTHLPWPEICDRFMIWPWPAYANPQLSRTSRTSTCTHRQLSSCSWAVKKKKWGLSLPGSRPWSDFFWNLFSIYRARKISSVPVAEMSRVPFFWSHFLSSWSQSCAKTQKFRRKKRSYLWDLLHTPGHEHHQWNDSKFLSLGNENRWKKKEKKKKLPEGSWAHFVLMKSWEEGVGVVV